MSICSKCKKFVDKTYDCDHTEDQGFCKDCYTKLHFSLTEDESS